LYQTENQHKSKHNSLKQINSFIIMSMLTSGHTDDALSAATVVRLTTATPSRIGDHAT